MSYAWQNGQTNRQTDKWTYLQTLKILASNKPTNEHTCQKFLASNNKWPHPPITHPLGDERTSMSVVLHNKDKSIYSDIRAIASYHPGLMHFWLVFVTSTGLADVQLPPVWHQRHTQGCIYTGVFDRFLKIKYWYFIPFNGYKDIS